MVFPWTYYSCLSFLDLKVMFICNHCPYVVHLKEDIVKLSNNYMPVQYNFFFLFLCSVQILGVVIWTCRKLQLWWNLPRNLLPILSKDYLQFQFSTVCKLHAELIMFVYMWSVCNGWIECIHVSCRTDEFCTWNQRFFGVVMSKKPFKAVVIAFDRQ